MSPVWVRLETEFETGPGNHLAVVGGVPELGDWDPARAVTCSSHGNVQTADVTMQELSEFEFKWILITTNGEVLRWQEGGNRRVLLPPDVGQVLVQAPWHNGPRVDQGEDQTLSRAVAAVKTFVVEQKPYVIAMATVMATAIAAMSMYTF